jgi:hypothetical protein
MYSRRTTLWFLGILTLVVSGFCVRYHETVCLSYLSFGGGNDPCRHLLSCFSKDFERDERRSREGQTIVRSGAAVFGVPIFILVGLVAKEAIALSPGKCSSPHVYFSVQPTASRKFPLGLGGQVFPRSIARFQTKKRSVRTDRWSECNSHRVARNQQLECSSGLLHRQLNAL